MIRVKLIMTSGHDLEGEGIFWPPTSLRPNTWSTRRVITGVLIDALDAAPPHWGSSKARFCHGREILGIDFRLAAGGLF